MTNAQPIYNNCASLNVTACHWVPFCELLTCNAMVRIGLHILDIHCTYSSFCMACFFAYELCLVKTDEVCIYGSNSVIINK